MLKKVVVLVIICLFFGAGVISNVIGNNLTEYKLHNKEIVLSENCLLNNPPMISNPNPKNGETVSIALNELSVFIEDPDGDRMNWTIETNPNVGSNSGVDETKGTKYCSISNLVYDTTYYWYVNATDGTYITSMVYSFKIGNEPSYIPTAVEIYLEVFDSIRGPRVALHIVNHHQNITEWNSKFNNKIRVKWYIENEDELYYRNSPVVINSRTREYQKDSALAELLFMLTEGGRIKTPGYKWIDIKIPIPTEKYNESEQLIDIEFTELDDMICAMYLFYFNIQLEPFYSQRTSILNIEIP